MIRMGRTEGDLAVRRPVPFAGWGACEHGMNGRSGKGVNWRSIGFCCRKVCYSDDNWKTTAKEQATQGVEQARLRHTLRADGGLVCIDWGRSLENSRPILGVTAVRTDRGRFANLRPRFRSEPIDLRVCIPPWGYPV